MRCAVARAGAGTQRGGDGLVRSILFLAPATVTLLERAARLRPLWPGRRRAGSDGAGQRLSDGAERELPGKVTLSVQAGDELTIETPGGGGWGNPRIAARNKEQSDDRVQILEEAKIQAVCTDENADKKRLEDNYHQRTSGLYLGDMIFGANDGIVTTFAVVAGASGASLSSMVVVVLGFANLMGDGLSMGIGNYLGRKSEAAYQKAQREKERFEIKHLREVELAETESILSERGYAGADLATASARDHRRRGTLDRLHDAR